MLLRARKDVADDLREKSGKNFQPTPKVEDTVLWESFVNRSESAFVQIYNDYFQILFQYGKQLTNDSELCKDILQDLFIELRAKRSKLPKVRSIKAFLIRSLRNKIFDNLRRKKNLNFVPYSEENHNFKLVPSQETLIIDKQISDTQIKQIQEAIANLSPQKKEALHLFYYNCLSYEEIREILGYSCVKSVRTLIYRALDDIKSIT